MCNVDKAARRLPETPRRLVRSSTGCGDRTPKRQCERKQGRLEIYERADIT